MTKLSFETYCSLGISVLISLLLIRQSVLRYTDQKTDILMEIIKWGRSKSIALLSIVFIASIFVSPYSINYFLNHNKLLDISTDKTSVYLSKSPAKHNDIPIEFIAGIITGVANIVIGNSYLNSFRKKEEKVKLAKLIVISIQGQVINLAHLATWLRDGSNCSFTRTPNEYYNDVYILIYSIKNDQLYKTTLSEIGIFDLEDSESIAKYSRQLNALMIETEFFINPCKEASSTSCRLDDKPLPLDPYRTDDLVEYIQDLQLYANLQILILSERFIKDDQRISSYKSDILTTHKSKSKEYSLKLREDIENDLKKTGLDKRI